MIRNVTRRVERLEARAMETARGPIVFRIHLVHREKGLTGVLLIESDETTTCVPPTPEDEEWFRTSSKWRPRAGTPSPGSGEAVQP